MKPEEREPWLTSQLWRATNAVRTLSALRKEKTSEIDERLRLIKEFQDSLFVKGTDSQQAELFDPAEMLPPAIERVLSAPSRGLQ